MRLHRRWSLIIKTVNELLQASVEAAVLGLAGGSASSAFSASFRSESLLDGAVLAQVLSASKLYQGQDLLLLTFRLDTLLVLEAGDALGQCDLLGKDG